MKIQLSVLQEAKAFPWLPISQYNLTRQKIQVSINLDMPQGESTKSSRHFTHRAWQAQHYMKTNLSLLYMLSLLRHIVVSSALWHPLNNGKDTFKSNQLHIICDLTKLHETNFSYAREWVLDQV